MKAALRDGIRRVGGAPAILIGAWLLLTAASLPATVVLRGMLAAHLGESLAGETAALGVNHEWMEEFAAQARGVGTSFRPTIIGFGAVLDNASAFLDRDGRPLAVAGTTAAYLLLWLFLAGGILDRYARDRATRASGFFAASGTFFFRFLRLGAVMLAAYAFLFGPVHSWLFDTLWGRLTRDMTVERTAFFLRAALYLVFGLLLAACNLLFDYAKVRAVVEDRRSMLGALAAAVRFVRTYPSAVAGLYAADFLLYLAAAAIYALVSPGAGRGALVWLAVAAGQAYVVARLWVKLVFWASEIALFQSRLAHAAYVAAPEPRWPESPAAEAILKT